MAEPASSTTPVRQWKGRSPEERVAERRAQLIEAGVELLGTGGVRALTMRAVCREVPLSPRYFYESFENVEELLGAVSDEVVGRALEAARSASSAAEGDIADRVRAIFDAFADLLEADPRVGRIMFRESLADPTLRRLGAESTLPFIWAVGQQVLADTGRELELGEAEAELATKTLAGALTALFRDWTEGRMVASRAELIDHCVVLTVSLLRL